MSDEPTCGSDQSGACGTNGDSQNQDKPPVDGNMVSYESHRKLLDEKKHEQAARIDAENRLKKLEDAAKSAENQKLKDKEEWKTYAERIEAELKNKLESAETQLKDYSERDAYVKKVSAFTKALDGDLDSRFYGFIPVDSIEFLPDSDTIDEMTVTKAVEAFRKENGDLIKKPGQHKMNYAAPGSGSKGLDYETWLTLPAKEMQARRKEVMQTEGDT